MNIGDPGPLQIQTPRPVVVGHQKSFSNIMILKYESLLNDYICIDKGTWF